MTLFLYVNGVRTVAEAQAAVAYGAGAVGIAIGCGQNGVEPEEAREIFLSLPLFKAKVGFFTATPRYEIEELITFCKLDALHFGCVPPDAKSYRIPLLLDVPAGKTEDLPLFCAGYVFTDPRDRQVLKEISRAKIWLKGFSAWQQWQAITEEGPYGLVLAPGELGKQGT